MQMGEEKFVANFHIVDAKSHPVLLGLNTLRYLGLLVEHPLVFIEAVKIWPVHMVKCSGTQRHEEISQDLERLGTCFAQHLPVRIFTRGTCQKHRNDTS